MMCAERGPMNGHIVPPPLTRRGSNRMPEALKQVFLEAQQGNDVHEPPKDKSAFKTFERETFEQPAQRPIRPLPREFKLQRVSSQTSLVDLLVAAVPPKSLKPQTGTTLVDLLEAVVPEEALGHSNESSNEATCALPPSRTRTPPANKTSPRAAPYPATRSPQVFLDVMLRTLGYPTECFRTMETAYFNKPTDLQVRSYHARLQDMVRSQDEAKLCDILSCGLSTNPCNVHGESLLHGACRKGYAKSVRVMLECGASVQVSNDFGRTPLHEALFSSSPSFEIVDLLIQKDRQLLHLCDRHGATPLSFVPREQWGVWIDFLYNKRHVYFPRRNKRLEGVAPFSSRMYEKPNSQPLQNPGNVLPPDMAAMVAAGKLSCEEARYLVEDDDDDTCTEDTSAGLSTDDSWYTDDEDSDDETEPDEELEASEDGQEDEDERNGDEDEQQEEEEEGDGISVRSLSSSGETLVCSNTLGV